MEYARVDPLLRVGRKAEVKGDLIGSLESDPLDVLGQSIGFVLQNALGATAVFFDEAHALRGRHTIGLQEHHDVAHGALLVPGGLDRLGALLADAGDLVEPAGLFADDAKCVGAEVIDNLLGVRFTDAMDEAATEVFADAVHRGG